MFIDFMYKEMLEKAKQVISNAPYLILSCDKVINVNNTSWIIVHCYIVQNFAWQSIFILLEHVTKVGNTTTSLTTLIVGSFMEKGGVLKE